MSEPTIEQFIDVLHEKVQFYGPGGIHDNTGVLQQIREALADPKPDPAHAAFEAWRLQLLENCPRTTGWGSADWAFVQDTFTKGVKFGRKGERDKALDDVMRFLRSWHGPGVQDGSVPLGESLAQYISDRFKGLSLKQEAPDA